MIPQTTPGPLPASAGQPPRVPMAFLPRLVWEAVLLILAAVTTIVVSVQGQLFDTSGGHFADRWAAIYAGFAIVGLLATGFALSLRTATPNLAVVALSSVAGMIHGQLVAHHWPRFAAALVAILATVAIGLLLGAITAWTAAPAWAVSLAGLALAQILAVALAGGPSSYLPPTDRPGAGLAVWIVLLVIVSVGGGALWFIPGLRTAFGAHREPASPGRGRPGLMLGALLGFGGSALAAAVAGVLTVTYNGTFGSRMVVTTELPLVVGAALLGGVSVFGRSGGIAGTMLATWLLYMAGRGLTIAGATRDFYTLLPAAVAIVIGLVVSVVFERLDARPPRVRATPPAGWLPAPVAMDGSLSVVAGSG